MKSRTDELIEALAETFWRLPTVAPDGTSQCTFAEELYFKKEEAAYELKQHLERLYESEKFFEGELRKCGDQPREGTKMCLADTRKSIAEAKKALARAATKKFPREPRGPFGRRVGQEMPSTRELLSNDHKVKHLMEGK